MNFSSSSFCLHPLPISSILISFKCTAIWYSYILFSHYHIAFFSFLSHSTLCLSLTCSIFFAFFFWFRSKEEIKFIYYAIIIKPIMKAISSVVSASMYLWLWNVINKLGGAYNNLIPLKTYSVDQHIFNFIYFFLCSVFFILYTLLYRHHIVNVFVSRMFFSRISTFASYSQKNIFLQFSCVNFFVSIFLLTFFFKCCTFKLINSLWVKR